MRARRAPKTVCQKTKLIMHVARAIKMAPEAAKILVFKVDSF